MRYGQGASVAGPGGGRGGGGRGLGKGSEGSFKAHQEVGPAQGDVVGRVAQARGQDEGERSGVEVAVGHAPCGEGSRGLRVSV